MDFENYNYSKHDDLWYSHTYVYGTFMDFIKKPIEKENRLVKLQKIKDIFYIVIHLGLDKEQLKYNKFYYNDLFDKLYDMSERELHEYNELMNGLALQEQMKNQSFYF